uniref:Uncharacterized protein n=1 Tax=Cucumis melo TaxID=3656 RepID=A0A9I9EKX7_CUCME
MAVNVERKAHNILTSVGSMSIELGNLHLAIGDEWENCEQFVLIRLGAETKSNNGIFRGWRKHASRLSFHEKYECRPQMRDDSPCGQIVKRKFGEDYLNNMRWKLPPFVHKVLTFRLLHLLRLREGGKSVAPGVENSINRTFQYATISVANFFRSLFLIEHNACTIMSFSLPNDMDDHLLDLTFYTHDDRKIEAYLPLLLSYQEFDVGEIDYGWFVSIESHHFLACLTMLGSNGHVRVSMINSQLIFASRTLHLILQPESL